MKISEDSKPVFPISEIIRTQKSIAPLSNHGYSIASTVCERYQVSATFPWRKAREGTFPKPHKLSAGITAWRNEDLLEWEQDPLNYKAKP